MTCICGHDEAVHRAMCGSPHGCACNKFVAARQEPEVKSFAAMTGEELMDWWFANKLDPESAFAALRDAIRAEALEESRMEHETLIVRYNMERTRAERAEQERDELKAELTDSTRCACGHEWSRHNASGCQSHKGKFLCKCPIPALPTEGVGAVDFAAADGDARQLVDEHGADHWFGNLARAYLALREQVATLTADNERLRGERAIADNAQLHAELAALRSPVPSGVTEAMVTAGINALDDVSGDKGLSMGRRERVRAILTAALAAAEQGERNG